MCATLVGDLLATIGHTLVCMARRGGAMGQTATSVVDLLACTCVSVNACAVCAVIAAAIAAVAQLGAAATIAACAIIAAAISDIAAKVGA